MLPKVGGFHFSGEILIHSSDKLAPTNYLSDKTFKTVYRDVTDTCYKYKAEEVQCPKDSSKIELTKIQHIEDNDKKEGLFTKIKNNFL